jgi:hypothetical protein
MEIGQRFETAKYNSSQLLVTIHFWRDESPWWYGVPRHGQADGSALRSSSVVQRLTFGSKLSGSLLDIDISVVLPIAPDIEPVLDPDWLVESAAETAVCCRRLDDCVLHDSALRMVSLQGRVAEKNSTSTGTLLSPTSPISPKMSSNWVG